LWNNLKEKILTKSKNINPQWMKLKKNEKKKEREEKKGRLFWNIIHPCQSPKELTRVSTKVMSYQSKKHKNSFCFIVFI